MPNQPARTDLTPAQANASFGIATHNFETAITAYSATQQETLRWWFFMAKERGWSLTKLSESTGVHNSTLSKVFRGVYAAEIDKVVATLVKAKELFAEASDNPEFIHTALAGRMFATFDKCRALGNVAILWGQMGIGKTTIIEEYRRLNNHGKTQVVRFPAAVTFPHFVSHVGRSIGINVHSDGQFRNRERIIAVLSAGKRLLIIDELHQAFLTASPETAVRCLEFLREISDVSKCGLVLIGTEVLAHEIFKGRHKEALGQLVNRGTVQIALPAKATKQDITRFLAYYGLRLPGEDEPEAREILGDIIQAAGLRKLTLHLRDGSAYAARKNETYTWSHFVAAFVAIQSLSK